MVVKSNFYMNIFLACLAFITYPNLLFSNELTDTNHGKHPLNVVIFFTEVDTKCLSLQKDTLSFLNLCEKTRVKHSQENGKNVDKAAKKGKESVYCKELLKNSLTTLTHFCHTVLKMKTAIASVSSQHSTNDIQGPDAPFHDMHIGLETPAKTKRSKNIFEPASKKKRPTEETIPSVTSGSNNVKNIITSSKHTEVFKIRVKRQENNKNEDKDIKIKVIDNSLEKRNSKPPWDVLDIMKHVRYSFLGKMFENTLNHQLKDEQEDLADITKLGKEKEDPGLFQMVKSTLSTLQEPPDENFIMVMFGGHLHGLMDKHSPIVQSIKHVIENTDAENTLIIVTGSCAEEEEKFLNEHGSEHEVHIVEQGQGSHSIVGFMPVYAKGPNCDMLASCTILYDIPLTVRTILEQHT